MITNALKAGVVAMCLALIVAMYTQYNISIPLVQFVPQKKEKASTSQGSQSTEEESKPSAPEIDTQSKLIILDWTKFFGMPVEVSVTRDRCTEDKEAKLKG